MDDGKRKPDAEASSSTISMRQRPSDERESGSPLPDSPEKINEPSESEANSEPPASYADVIGNNYYVFLSFRGLDTRKGFVDHLYHELVRVGLYHPNFVFRDDESLDFGEPIAKSILSAIKCSKVSIPVISETYAASKCCLHEIIQIMKCVESGEQKVYPVLYKVTPGDVRDMKGKFGEAFHNPENGFDEELKREGPVALRKALDRELFESEKFADGYEGKLVKAVVEKIMCEQQHVDLVGIDDHVAKVMKLANTTSSDTQIIVIYGIAGIGKTTLATAIYKKLSNKFENKFDCRSFLKDIRETIKGKGMKHVQSLHISNLTNNSGHNEHDYGIEMIQAICKNKKVLIVLDDVDRQEHLDNLFGGCDFKSGSWIIITCRDEALFESEFKGYKLFKSECKGYKLEGMNLKNSLLLFCRYAFKREKPPIEFTALSNDIVASIGGLPLSLVIIGSFLKGKEQSIWTETLEKLKRAPPMDVQQKLRISYDSLEFEKLKRAPPMDVQQKLRISYDSLEYEEQQMFLDIACFFIGINKRFAAYLWEDLQYSLESGLERMIELSLMKIDDNNKFRMHDQLRDLGRAMACPAQKKPWKCSRLWDEKAIIVQRSKFCIASMLLTTLQVEDPSVTQEENRYIEALLLDENGSKMFMNRRSFKRMPCLKYLHLSKVVFYGNFEDSLSELRWLKWEKCPDSFEATNVHLENLLIFDLSSGYISHKWRGWSSIKMERLKVLNLSQCGKLKRTPNLSALKSLEMLILEDCYYLEEIDPSIGDVKCLTSLNLVGCSHLQELPDSISHLVNLSTLDLRFCTSFKKFPKSIGSLVKLQHLLLGNRPLPSEDSKGWNCWDSYHFKHIPKSIGKLESLIELHLTCANISKLPKSIGDLKSLKILIIAKCEQLSSLPSTLSKLCKLEELDATTCYNLEGEVSINRLSSLKILRLGKIGYTMDLFEWYEQDVLLSQNFDDLFSIENLEFTNCNFPANLTVLEITCQDDKLPQLFHLIHLKELSFQICKNLESIPPLPSGILKLSVLFCGQLKELPSLLSLESLSELLILGCGELMKIEGLKGLKSLGRLCLSGCKKLLDLNGLEHLKSLRQLEIEDLEAALMNLLQVQCLGRLKNLERLCVARCQSLKRLDISQLTHIRELLVLECEDVDEIQGLEGLKKLTFLNINGCKSIGKLPDLSLFENLSHLDIRGCSNLQEDVQGLEGLERRSYAVLRESKKRDNCKASTN